MSFANSPKRQHYYKFNTRPLKSPPGAPLQQHHLQTPSAAKGIAIEDVELGRRQKGSFLHLARAIQNTLLHWPPHSWVLSLFMSSINHLLSSCPCLPAIQSAVLVPLFATRLLHNSIYFSGDAFFVVVSSQRNWTLLFHPSVSVYYSGNYATHLKNSSPFYSSERS